MPTVDQVIEAFEEVANQEKIYLNLLPPQTTTRCNLIEACKKAFLMFGGLEPESKLEAKISLPNEIDDLISTLEAFDDSEGQMLVAFARVMLK